MAHFAMSSLNLNDPTGKQSQQATATSSEVAAPTVQSRRAFGGAPRTGTPRPSETGTSSQTMVENAGPRLNPGLNGLSDMTVQNIAGRILPNHTAESFDSAWFLSLQISHIKAELSVLEDDDPRADELRWKQIEMCTTYHSLAKGINDTLSRPKPPERHTNKLAERVKACLSETFRGKEGTWLKSQDLADHSHLTGAMLPLEVFVRGLIQDGCSIFKFASEKPVIDKPRYRSWLSPFVRYAVQVGLRILMSSAMVIPVAAAKLWSLSPEVQVAMHAATVIVCQIAALGMVRDLDSQMLLTMTAASIIAEMLGM